MSDTPKDSSKPVDDARQTVHEELRANEDLPLSKWKQFKENRFGRKFLDILYETTVMIFYLGAIALLHLVLNSWLGESAMFFGKIPIS